MNSTIWDRVWRQESENARPSGYAAEYEDAAWGAVRALLPAGDFRFLDAGCGAGEFCFRLAAERPASEVLGVDASGPAVERAIRRARRQASGSGREPALEAAAGARSPDFLLADLKQLALPPERFDLVLSLGVVCYFDPPGLDRAFAEFRRVLAPGGSLIVGVPNRWNLPHTLHKAWAGPRYEYGPERSWSGSGLARLLRERGFEDVRTAGYDPAYGLLRLGRWKVLDLAGRAARKLAPGLDRMSGGAFSRSFGFYVLAAGRKPRLT